MRLFTLALPLTAALVLALPATAARAPKVTTEFTGTPVVTWKTFAGDPRLRDVTITAHFTHSGPVGVQVGGTVNGVFTDPGPIAKMYQGTGSETFTWVVPGNDTVIPGGIVPGTKISFTLQLVKLGARGHTTVLNEITTATYTIT